MALWYALVDLLPFEWAQPGQMYFMKHALLAVLVAIPAVIILGVLLALFQRIREIQKGEEDDAKNY